MSRRLLPCFLCLLLLLAAAAGAASPKVSPGEAEGYVRRCCRSTSYPRACERSLVPRAPAVGLSPRRLAQAALAAAADAARNCSAYIGSPSSYTSKGGGAHIGVRVAHLAHRGGDESGHERGDGVARVHVDDECEQAQRVVLKRRLIRGLRVGYGGEENGKLVGV